MNVLTSPERIRAARRSDPVTSHFYLLASVIMAVYAALAIGDAFTTAPWCDEAWLANPALTFLRKGYFGTPILTPFGWGPPLNLVDIQHKTYWIMPLHMLTQVGWYRLFGFSLISYRALSVSFGAVLLAALGYLGYQLSGRRRIALLAMAIAGTDFYMLTRDADGRMDIMATAFVISALGVYAAYRETDLTRAVAFGGIFAALAAFTHPEGGFFAIGGLAVFAICSDRRRIRIRHLVLFIVPFVFLGLCWSLYVMQDVPTFRAQMYGNSYGRWIGVTNPYWSIYGELRYKYLKEFGLISFNSFSLHNLRLIPLGLYCAAALTLRLTPTRSTYLPREKSGIRALLWILAFFVFGGMAFDGSKRFYYLTYVVALFALTLAIWLDRLLDGGARARAFALAAAGLLIVIQIGGTLYRIHKNEYNSFAQAAQFVQAHNPDQALVYGSGELGFYLNFPDYLIDDITFGYYSGRPAKFIFVPKVFWEEWIGNMSTRDATVGRYEQATLAHDYKVAFSNPNYKVYERNP